MRYPTMWKISVRPLPHADLEVRSVGGHRTSCSPGGVLIPLCAPSRAGGALRPSRPPHGRADACRAAARESLCRPVALPPGRGAPWRDDFRIVHRVRREVHETVPRPRVPVVQDVRPANVLPARRAGASRLPEPELPGLRASRGHARPELDSLAAQPLPAARPSHGLNLALRARMPRSWSCEQGGAFCCLSAWGAPCCHHTSGPPPRHSMSGDASRSMSSASGRPARRRNSRRSASP